MSYLLYDHWGGVIRDAKKTESVEDDLMCWAAAAANVLAWTGWGDVPGQSFNSETSIFQYFQEHFEHSVGYPHKAWMWWFNGRDPENIDVDGGGFWQPNDTSFDDFFEVEHDRGNCLASLARYINSGYGVALDLISQSGGHCITCWGYEQNPAGEYIGIYVTDSDYPPYTMQYYQVERDTSGQQEWGHFKDWWYFTYHKNSTRYLIATVYALAKRPVPSVPQNFTMR